MFMSTLSKEKIRQLHLDQKFRSAKMKKLRLVHNSYSRDYVCYLTRNPQLISSKNISSINFVVSHLHFLILLDYREMQKTSFSKRNMGTDFCTIRSTVSDSQYLLDGRTLLHRLPWKKVTLLMRYVSNTADMSHLEI